jgi:hypothetical protein
MMFYFYIPEGICFRYLQAYKNKNKNMRDVINIVLAIARNCFSSTSSAVL